MSENLNLKKTILIEDKEYDINAVYSDEAGKVTTPLVIKESGEEVGKYYGSTDTHETTKSEINYVSATGGTFTGPVNIYTDKTDVTGVTDSEIINYGQVDHIVSKLTGAPIYTWDVNTGYNAKTDSTGADYKLNTVIGSIEDLPIFEAYSCGQAHNKYVTPDSYDNAYITYGTYKDAYFNQAYNDIRGSITKLVFPNTYIDKDTGEKKSVEKIRVNEFTANTSQNYGFTNLATVHINPGITEIGNNAFSGCEKLTSVAIPDSVNRIGLNTFSGCTGLTNVVFGGSIIDAGAFSDCTSLTSIVLCNNDVQIAKAKKVGSTNYLDAFSGCSALTKIYFKGSLKEWNTRVAGLDSNNPLRSATIVSISDTAFPFLYICKGADSEDTSLASNKMFLKLPGQALVEVSKGAVRLERWDSKPNNNTDYFTYDVLAAVITGINSRITALGSKALALPEKLIISDTTHVAIPELSEDIQSADEDKTLIVEETVVPTVQQLQTQLTNLTGLNQEHDYANNDNKPMPVRNAKADDNGDEIKTNYYHTSMITDSSDNIIGNSIRIVNTIPTNTPGTGGYLKGAEGDIVIVI